MRDHELGINVKDLLTLIVAILIIFQNPLMGIHSAFRYIDELLTIGSILYIVGSILQKQQIRKSYAKMIVLMILIEIVGLISNVTSDIHRSTSMIVLDSAYVLKDFICFIAAGMYFGERRLSKRQMRVLCKGVHLIVLIAFICMCISQIVDIGMTYKVRYGIKCFKFVYKNPGMWSQYCIIFLLILTVEIQNQGLDRKRIGYLVMLILSWLASCRSRAYAIVALWLFLMYVSNNIIDPSELSRKNARNTLKGFMKPHYIIFAVIVMAALGWNQMQEYFGDEAITARNLLVKGGIRIAQDYFPLGSGFGTYGTEVAANYYSPLYSRYRVNLHWGLVEGGSELTDCYWPAVGAELGIIGLVLMAFLIMLMIKQLIKSAGARKYCVITALTYSAYLLLSSMVTGIFASYITAGAVIICMAVISAGNRTWQGGGEYGNNRLV